MKKRLLSLLKLLPLVAIAAVVMAARPASDFSLRTIRTGEPVYVGTLTSTGTSVSNATTAFPFTLNGGELLKFICDAEGWVNPGATAGLTFTAATIATLSRRRAHYLLLRSPTTAISMISTTGTANCAVWKML